VKQHYLHAPFPVGFSADETVCRLNSACVRSSDAVDKVVLVEVGITGARRFTVCLEQAVVACVGYPTTPSVDGY